jgi:hypothetical protein
MPPDQLAHAVKSAGDPSFFSSTTESYSLKEFSELLALVLFHYVVLNGQPPLWGTEVWFHWLFAR